MYTICEVLLYLILLDPVEVQVKYNFSPLIQVPYNEISKQFQG